MMKRTGKLFVSMTSLGILLNNVAYAATEVVEESKDGASTKYLFMGVAALVIILLLFLGYKMDTKGNSDKPTKVSHKAEKVKKKLSEKTKDIKANSGTYEADEEAYEEDGEIFDNDDLNDSVEYNDEEDSLFAATSEEIEDGEETGFSSDDLVQENVGFTTKSVKEDVIEEPEEEDLGEEFDTSIIDGLDDEEDSKNSFDETMLFNSSDFSATGSSLEDEINSLDNDFAEENIELIKDEEDDNFIEELKSFEEPANDFEGFSVVPKKEKVMEEKTPKKYTKKIEGDKSEEIEKPIQTSSSIDDDFLSQMEANLQKKHDERVAKKEVKTTKKTTKKKDN